MPAVLKLNWWWLIIGLGAILLIGLLLASVASQSAPLIYQTAQAGNDATEVSEPVPTSQPAIRYVATPSAVKAIYMTQCVVGTPSFREELVKLIADTELNAVVIDIKDYSGGIAFPTTDPKLSPYVSQKCGATDMKDFVARLHDQGIYVIGRITVFQDPLYTAANPALAVKRASDGGVWKDDKGLSFIDVGAKPFWDYIVTLARASHALGFDELNFDYVRYPSDGNMKDIAFTHSGTASKAENLELFFAYLHQQLQPDGQTTPEQAPVISADLFGMTTTNTDDLNIGQVLERALPYFDYVAPMIYPSHYPKTFNGWANPNAHVYELIHYVLQGAVKRTIATTTKVPGLTHTPQMKDKTVPATGTTATTTEKIATGLYEKPAYDKNKIRPWLQDFDYGGDYDVAEVKAQIQATYDAGLNSWMLWAPSNRYTRGALNAE